MTPMLQRFDQGLSDGNSIVLEDFSRSLIEPALDGEEEEDMFDDIQGDLAGIENDIARNPR